MTLPVVELAIRSLFITSLVAAPVFAVLAYIGLAKYLRDKLPPWCACFGLASVFLTLLNWLAYVALLIGAQIGWRDGALLDEWAMAITGSVILAAALGFGLKGSARIQAVTAGALMSAIWIIQIVTQRS